MVNKVWSLLVLLSLFMDAPDVNEGEGSAAGGTSRLFLRVLLSNGPKRTRAAASVVTGQRHRELGRLRPTHHAHGWLSFLLQTGGRHNPTFLHNLFLLASFFSWPPFLGLVFVTVVDFVIDRDRYLLFKFLLLVVVVLVVVLVVAAAQRDDFIPLPVLRDGVSRRGR